MAIHNAKDNSFKRIFDNHRLFVDFIRDFDKIRGNKGETLLRHLPEDYIEKLSLQIPENLVKLLSDVIRVLLDKSGYDRQEIEKYVGYAEKLEGQEEESKKRDKERLDNARNALAKGIPVEHVQIVSGLDMETIKSLG